MASLGAQAAASPLWAFGTLCLGFLMELLLVCTAERRGDSAPGQEEALDLSLAGGRGQA